MDIIVESALCHSPKIYFKLKYTINKVNKEDIFFWILIFSLEKLLLKNLYLSNFLRLPLRLLSNISCRIYCYVTLRGIQAPFELQSYKSTLSLMSWNAFKNMCSCFPEFEKLSSKNISGSDNAYKNVRTRTVLLYLVAEVEYIFFTFGI
jgi:hypothetical protein